MACRIVVEVLPSRLLEWNSGAIFSARSEAGILAMFGIGPLELLILAVLAVVGAVVIGVLIQANQRPPRD